jgi:hypothetical protein
MHHRTRLATEKPKRARVFPVVFETRVGRRRRLFDQDLRPRGFYGACSDRVRIPIKCSGHAFLMGMACRHAGSASGVSWFRRRHRSRQQTSMPIARGPLPTRSAPRMRRGSMGYRPLQKLLASPPRERPICCSALPVMHGRCWRTRTMDVSIIWTATS